MLALDFADLFLALGCNELKCLVVENVLPEPVNAGAVLRKFLNVGLRVGPSHHGFPGGCLSQVFIGTPIDDYVANSIVAQLLFLQMEDPKKEIHVYINSPGGSVSDGMAIYDTLNFMQCDIVTYCIGMAASMSTVLLAAGTPGKRFALPNSRVMIHQPSGGAGGQTSDISIAAKEILRWRRTINEILSKHSGKTIEQLEKDSDRDYYMSAEEAKDYGLVDEVISKKPNE